MIKKRKIWLGTAISLPIITLTALTISFAFAPKEEKILINNDFTLEKETNLIQEIAQFKKIKTIFLPTPTTILELGDINESKLKKLPGITLPKLSNEIKYYYEVIEKNNLEGEVTIKIDFEIADQIIDSHFFTITGFEKKTSLEIHDLAQIDKNKFTNFSLHVPKLTSLPIVGPTSEMELVNLTNTDLPPKTKDISRFYKILSINAQRGEAIIEIAFFGKGKKLNTITFKIDGFETMYQKNMLQANNETIDFAIARFDNLALTLKEKLKMPPIGSIATDVLNDLPGIKIPPELTNAKQTFEIIATDYEYGKLIIKVAITGIFQQKQFNTFIINGFEQKNTLADEKIKSKVNNEQKRINEMISQNSQVSYNHVLWKKQTGYLSYYELEQLGLNFKLNPEFCYQYEVKEQGVKIIVKYNNVYSTTPLKFITLSPSIAENNLLVTKNTYIAQIRDKLSLNYLANNYLQLQPLFTLDFDLDKRQQILALIITNQTFFIERLTQLDQINKIENFFNGLLASTINAIEIIIRQYQENKIFRKIQAQYFLEEVILFNPKPKFNQAKMALIKKIKASSLLTLINQENDFYNEYVTIWRNSLVDNSFYFINIPEGLHLPPEIQNIPENAFIFSKIPKDFFNWKGITNVNKNAFSGTSLKKGVVMNKKLEYAIANGELKLANNLKWSNQKSENNVNYIPQDGEIAIEKWII